VKDNKGSITNHVGTYTDITERKQTEEIIKQLAYHDALTQLPNRRLLTDRLQQAMAASARSQHYGALMFLDLDNFKPLNDTYGHEAGDLLLIEATHRLISCVREMDTVARFGGDEFVIMISELGTDKADSTVQTESIAEKIRTTLSAPYCLTIKHNNEVITVQHHCTASIGITLFIGNEATQDDLLKWADDAMYQAKEDGRNLIRFHAGKTRPF
jgi:diguanylate cyclase (GGDEF)-like protein